MPHWLGATYQRTRHGDTLSDDDNWQSPQPLKRLEPLLLDVSDGVSALNKSARV